MNRLCIKVFEIDYDFYILSFMGVFFFLSILMSLSLGVMGCTGSVIVTFHAHIHLFFFCM